MVGEYDSIVRNSVWDVVPRSENKSVVSSRWLYKVKQAFDGSVEKHKARFVTRGFSQVEGIDYDETFAPVARYSFIRLMLALSAHMDWNIHQMDVKTAFLNGKIEEEVYIEQPEGFETFDRESHVCRLKRDLYGLKQAPHAWYTRINSYFTGLGFTKSEADANLYHIMVEVNQLCQAMVYPTKLFWKAGKHVLRYLRGTSQYGLWYRRTEGVKLQGFIDVDWARSPLDRKSTSRGIFNLGLAVVSWYNRKQRLVALSSAEAEYMAASQAACDVIWMRKVLVGLFDQRKDPTVIFCDNQSCIKLFENPVLHDRSKHIDIQYHHLRDCVVKRIMLLQYVSTKEKDVGILTKALSKCKFEFHKDRIRVTDNPFLVEREC
eukprot:PITA_23341